MAWTANGQIENGLHLEKNEATFFKFIASVLNNSLELRLWFIFSSKIHLMSLY